MKAYDPATYPYQKEALLAGLRELLEEFRAWFTEFREPLNLQVESEEFHEEVIEGVNRIHKIADQPLIHGNERKTLIAEGVQQSATQNVGLCGIYERHVEELRELIKIVETDTLGEIGEDKLKQLAEIFKNNVLRSAHILGQRAPIEASIDWAFQQSQRIERYVLAWEAITIEDRLEDTHPFFSENS